MSTVERVLSIAKAEEGYREGYSNGSWNNKQKYSPAVPGLEWSDWQAWCATFVSWVAMTAEVSALFPRTASCYTGVQWFKRKGRFSEYPAVGAQVFFGSGGGTHTGLVYAYDADYIYTVEGNTNDRGSAQGNGVYLQKRERRDAYVYGYGYPEFPEGIVSADPAWAGQKPAEPAPAPVSYVPFPGAGWFTKGRKSPVVLAMRKRLIAVGCNRYKSSADPDVIGSGDVASYEAWQRKCGYTGSAATWPPGKTTWDALKVPK
ncbi:peptidoglycan-binding protein [Streptomyces sp. NPDC059874]|uniref:peptidoglycan-binding protein n=1 Tax=Streptomyces sp. NPDC059874 TaxID=3346983 RepID=UPI00364DC5B4